MSELNAKLKQYGALSAGLIIAGVKVGKTQILYTDVAPDAVVTTNGSIAIDLDQNATDDLDLEQYFYYYYSTYNSVVATNHPNADLVSFGVSTFRVDKMDEGETIDGSNSYTTSTYLTLGYNNSTSYDWSNNAPHMNKYLGVELTVGANTHYGWIRLDYDLNSAGFTVKDFALELTPNKAILAGDVNLTVADETFMLDENSMNGTTVGTLTTTGLSSPTFSILSGNAGNTFSVNGTGDILVNDSTMLDFETNPSFVLEVEADNGSIKDTATVTINLQNVNEAPVAAATSLNVPSNATNGTLVGTVAANDPENDALTFTITGGDPNSTFAIDNAGQITINDASTIDVSTTPSYTLMIDISDGTNTTSTSATIDLDDVTGITENNEIDFELYPNPIVENGAITIQLPSISVAEISILDAQGKLVKSINANKPTMRIETADLTKGIYFIKIESDDQRIGIRRLVIQ